LGRVAVLWASTFQCDTVEALLDRSSHLSFRGNSRTTSPSSWDLARRGVGAGHPLRRLAGSHERICMVRCLNNDIGSDPVRSVGYEDVLLWRAVVRKSRKRTAIPWSRSDGPGAHCSSVFVYEWRDDDLLSSRLDGCRCSVDSVHMFLLPVLHVRFRYPNLTNRRPNVVSVPHDRERALTGWKIVQWQPRYDHPH
jgi:hypothetical protein